MALCVHWCIWLSGQSSQKALASRTSYKVVNPACHSRHSCSTTLVSSAGKTALLHDVFENWSELVNLHRPVATVECSCVHRARWDSPQSTEGDSGCYCRTPLNHLPKVLAVWLCPCWLGARQCYSNLRKGCERQTPWGTMEL